MLQGGEHPSPRTIEEYRSAISDLLLWFEDKNICPLEATSEHIQMFVSFLQSHDAPAQMERIRAAWYGREPRLTYQHDWRGAAALSVLRGYLESAHDAARESGDVRRSSILAAKTGTANRSHDKVRPWLAPLSVIMATYAHTPRPIRSAAYKANTVTLKTTLVRNFYRLMLSRNLIRVNPALEIKLATLQGDRSKAMPPRSFTDDEARLLLGSCTATRARTPRKRMQNSRDATILLLAFVAGVGAAAISNLNVSDYDRTAADYGTLLIRRLKESRNHEIQLIDELQTAIEHWLAYRALLNPQTDALFVTLNPGYRPGGTPPNERMTVRAVRDMFDERQRRLGLKQAGRSFDALRRHVR